MTNFATEFAKVLYNYRDDTAYIHSHDVQQMLTQAALALLDSLPDPDPITVHREISPEDWMPQIIISDKASNERLLLYPQEVALLRALLLSFDETAPPRPGEPLTTPVRLKDGRVVSVFEEGLGE